MSLACEGYNNIVRDGDGYVTHCHGRKDATVEEQGRIDLGRRVERRQLELGRELKVCLDLDPSGAVGSRLGFSVKYICGR